MPVIGSTSTWSNLVAGRPPLAQSNASVDRVLGLLARDRNWWNLWKVYETIRNAVRDAVRGTAALTSRLQWVTETDVEAFRESANNPDVSGDAARHAIPTRPTSPTQTMTLPEGQAFINDLVAKWRDWVANPYPPPNP